MFDFSFGEIAVIGVVALVVLGPEKLPKVARTAGHLMGRARAYANQVKSDIDREVQMDELRKLQQQAQEAARSFESTVNEASRTVEQEAAKIEASASANAMPDPGLLPTPAASHASGVDEIAALETSIAEQAAAQSTSKPTPAFAQHSPAIAEAKADAEAKRKAAADVR